MAYYVTVAKSMTQATQTYAAVQTAPDGSTVSKITVPGDVSAIVGVGAAVVIDGAHTINTGNNFILEISGNGVVEGTQEMIVASMESSETGTSVTGAVDVEAAFYQAVNIKLKPGNDVILRAAFDGTDPGTPFLAITLVLA